MNASTPQHWHVRTTDDGTSLGARLTEVVAADGTVIASDEPYYPEALNPAHAPLIAAAPALRDALAAFVAALARFDRYAVRLAALGIDADEANADIAAARVMRAEARALLATLPGGSTDGR